MPPANAFAVLLDCARGGDRDALAALLREYEPALRRFARSHLGPTLRPYADSIDLVQSTHKSLMIALWSDRYEFSSPDKLLALATTILRRKVARLAEHTGRLKRSDIPPDGDDAPPGLLQSLPAAEADPADTAAFHNSLEHIGRQLSEREQSILRLLLQGHSRKEIAESLGEDPHVFRVYWGRVLARLRESGALNDWLTPSVTEWFHLDADSGTDPPRGGFLLREARHRLQKWPARRARHRLS